MEYIEIGTIVNTHGIKGELKIQSISDFDSVRYKKGAIVYILHDGKLIPMKARSFRRHKGMSLVAFEEITDINAAEAYKNDKVLIDASTRAALPEGQYYFSDLANLAVVDEEGNRIGTCIQVETTNGAQNNLRIRMDNGKETLVPNVPLFVKKIDLDTGTITIHVIEGLL